MSFASPRRHRPSRGTSLNLPPNSLARAIDVVRRPDVLLRAAAFVMACLILWAVTGSGTPPFAYRRGYVPPRKIIARVDFSREKWRDTKEKAKQTAEAAPYRKQPAAP
jgi:hypothetical protein